MNSASSRPLRFGAPALELAGDEPPLALAEPPAADAAPCQFEIVTHARRLRCARRRMGCAVRSRRTRHPGVPAFNWNWHWCNHYLRRDSRRSPRRRHRPPVPAASSWCGRSSPMRVGGLLQPRWMGEPVSQYGDVLVEDRRPTRSAHCPPPGRTSSIASSPMSFGSRACATTPRSPRSCRSWARSSPRSSRRRTSILRSAPRLPDVHERHSSSRARQPARAAKKLARIARHFASCRAGRRGGQASRVAAVD